MEKRSVFRAWAQINCSIMMFDRHSDYYLQTLITMGGFPRSHLPGQNTTWLTASTPTAWFTSRAQWLVFDCRWGSLQVACLNFKHFFGWFGAI